MFKKSKKRLGDILIEHGVLDNDGLERALAKQKKEGGLLGEVLLKMGLVKEEDIVIALAQQFNFPYLPVQNCEINAKLIKAIPITLVQKYVFIPIDRINNVITLIMVDPTNEKAKQDIEEATGLRVQALVGTVTEITTAIRKHYKLKDGIIDATSPAENVSQVSFQEAVKEEEEKKKNNKTTEDTEK